MCESRNEGTGAVTCTRHIQTLLHVSKVSTLDGYPEASDDDAQAVKGDEESDETANDCADARRAGAVAIDDRAAAALAVCMRVRLLCVTC